MSKFKHDRPTIGILPGWSALAGKTPDRYLASVLKGIQSAARIRECHLLLGWGLGRGNDPNSIHPAWPEVSPDSDFVPVGPWNTDGLIIFAPLRYEARSLYLQKLSDQSYPVLFIATGEREPMISIDNEAGIHQAVAHLVDHGHRDIGFIAGDPNDKGDSESRLRAYHSAVVNYGLDTDPRLVAQGWHTFSGGYDAARKIIDSEVKLTALVASDDISAIGAMQAIRDNGLRIPRDIAIIGFDDQPDAIAQVPPLTSIHVPLTEIGQQALMLIVDHLTRQHRLESVRIPTRLVPRQSCGCMPHVVLSAGDGKPQIQASPKRSRAHTSMISKVKQQIVNEMLATLPSALRFPSGERIQRLCTNLLQAFYSSLKDGSSAHFQATLMELLHELELADDNIDPWQDIISTLRREMTQLPAAWRQSHIRGLAEDMLHQARAAISESAQRQDYRHQYQQEITDQTLSELTARLSVTLDERQAVEVFEASLADMGIRHARVALFEAEGDDPVARSVLLSSRSELTSPRFSTREFPPPALYPSNEVLNLALIPLVFQDERLGYVAFDAGNLSPCAIIARQLAATFKASRLHTQVVELSLRDPLTGIHNRRYFDLILNNEVNRSKRFGHRLAIIMLDIDHFKKYNDTYGHPAGDKAIQNAAHCVTSGRRSGDTVARIGGEEFALILPETDIEGALVVTEKIRAAIIGSSAFEHPITVSMGISTAVGTDLEAGTLLQQADFALYQAKRMGRNRICVFQNEATLPGS